jgi:hypothetical protein
MIDGALELLESLSELDVVTDIIPGVIEPARARENDAVYQYETKTGCKLILKGGGAVQEVFVVTEFPELVREWAALAGAGRGETGGSRDAAAPRRPARPRPEPGPVVEETELSRRPPELRGIRPDVKMVTINRKMRDAYVASLAGADDGWAVEEIVPPEQAEALRRRGTETETETGE